MSKSFSKNNRFLFILMLLVLGYCIQAQTPTNTELIYIENADNQVTDTKSKPPTRYFNGNVVAYHEGAFIYCDTAIMINNDLFAYGNVSIIQEDTIRTFADTLYYKGDSLVAYLLGNVALENGKEKLFTQKLDYKTDTKVATFRQKALMVSDTTEIKSQNGIYDLSAKKARLSGLVTVEGKAFKMKVDSLDFFTDKQKAEWYSPTVIFQDKAEIYSLAGYYFLKSKIGRLIGDAQYKEDEKIASADTLDYLGETQEILLKKNAYYKSAEQEAKGEIIKYNRSSENTIIEGNAWFKDANNEAVGQKLEYNKDSGIFKLEGGGKIIDKESIINGEKINYDKNKEIGFISGSVIWQDTVNNSELKSDSLYIRGQDSYFKAISFGKKPIMSIEIDGDTMHIASDTLQGFEKIIARDSITNDTIKYFIGDNNVEIFKSDLQSVADSLVYNSLDSMFLLIGSPFMWKDTTQMNGDSIKIFLKNKTIDRLEIIENALVITSPDMLYFNQIRGRAIYADFKEKTLDKMKVNGNAQCIYYLIDDEDGYIGVNKTDCSLMIFEFVNKEIETIRFYTEPTSEILPMDEADHESIKLKGFNWNIDKRPKDVNDLID